MGAPRKFCRFDLEQNSSQCSPIIIDRGGAEASALSEEDDALPAIDDKAWKNAVSRDF